MSEKLPIRNDIVMRLGIVYFAMLLLGVIIIGKMLYLQIWEKEKWHKANTLTYKDITVEATRGDIYAADNRLLVSSVPYFEIYMDLHGEALTDAVFYKNVDALSTKLAAFFRDSTKTAKDWSKELRQARKKRDGYHLISKRVDYAQFKILKTFPIFKLGKYKGGLIAESRTERRKPYKSMAARTIGRTKNQSEAHSTIGIEGAYDYYLKGTNGIRLMQKLSGNVWKPINDGNEVEPMDGCDIITTLDINIQDVAEQALLKHLASNNADHGTAVVMEVKTGEIKAITNLGKTEDGTYAETYNYAVGESSEPGSTFKLASLMVALEDGFIELDDTVHTGNGIRYYYGFPIRDTKPEGYGTITIQEAFELSSNVAVSWIASKYYKTNPRKFIDRLYSFNLNDKIGIEIKGESTPYIKYPGDTLWTGISLPQMAIGYEIRLTPLQILTFYNAVANNGKMVKPHFVKSISEHGQTIKTFGTEVVNNSICSKETIRKVKKLLEGVVERGTAKNLRNNSYKIAGKTGTAQLANRNYGYKIIRDTKQEISYQSSFAGFFPADKPKYSCIVVINSPSNIIYYGGLVAGPVFREIADKIYNTDAQFQNELSTKPVVAHTDLPYSKFGHKRDLDNVLAQLSIPSLYSGDLKSNWMVTTKTAKGIKYESRTVSKTAVPNVVGMGLRDALYILENAGLIVDIEGHKGSVNKQSLAPGSNFKKGTRIKIEVG